VLALVVAAVLAAAALLFGAVHTWAAASIEISLFFLTAAALATGVRSTTPPEVRLAAAALLAWLSISLLPLPPRLLAALSPAVAERHRLVASAVGSALDGGEIRPVGGIEDEWVPPSERERLRELAASARRSLWPAGWRPAAVDPFAARGRLRHLLAAAAVFWLAAGVPAPRRLLVGLVTSAALLAGLGLVQFFTWNGRLLWFFEPSDWGGLRLDSRLTGPFVNPDHFGAFAAMCLPPSAALWVLLRRETRHGRKGIASMLGREAPVAAAVLLVAALVGSGSRGAVIAAAFGLAVFSLAVARRSHRPTPAGTALLERLFRALERAIAPGLALLLLAGGLVLAGGGARERLGERLAGTFQGPSIEMRTALWRQTLPLVRDHWLLGVGLGGWRVAFSAYESYPLAGYRHNHAHQDYLEWTAEAGLPGAALAFVLLVCVVRWAKRNSGIPSIARAGFAAGALAIGLHEAVDFPLRVPANSFFLAAFAGLATNPSWRLPRPLERPSGGRILLAAGVAALLGLESLRSLAEWRVGTAVRRGQIALPFAPVDADTWHELGRVLRQKGFRYLPPTAEVVATALVLRPLSPESLHELYLVSTTLEARRRALEAALALRPAAASWRLERAAALSLEGRSEDALREVELAALLDPRFFARFRPPEKELQPGVAEAVERGLGRALSQRPNDPVLLAEVAEALSHLGRPHEAASLWKTAAERIPKFRLRAVQALARVGRYGEAEVLARQAIRDDPQRERAYRLLAELVLRPQQRFAEAEAILRRGKAASSASAR
jgi:O-antigen ligase